MAEIDAYRKQYVELAAIFQANNLRTKPFRDRLSGETDLGRVKEGVAAMRNFLVANGVAFDESSRNVPEDNLPEYQLASREHANDYLLHTPVRGTAPAKPPTFQKLGVHPMPDRFYMVGDVPMQAIKGKSGHLYARRRSPNGKWEYVKGAIYAIRERGRHATVADIAAYGLASGQCFVCGKKLSDPKSVRAGIGPVCAKLVGK